MKDLNKLFKEALEDVEAVGIPHGEIAQVIPNSSFKKTWGLCSYYSKIPPRFKIQISTRLLENDVSDDATKETIIHEILHTCNGCMNHGKKWKYYADIINWKYKGRYKISRTTSNEKKGIDFDESQYKYVIQCKGCGTKAGYSRACSTLDHVLSGNVKCKKCGGVFEFVKGGPNTTQMSLFDNVANEEDNPIDRSTMFNDNYYKYVIKCEKCGIKVGYSRINKILKAVPRGYITCKKCGGTFRMHKGNI